MTIATGKIKTIGFALNEVKPKSIVEAIKLIHEYDIPEQWEITPVYDGHDPMSIRGFLVTDCRERKHSITLKQFIKVKQYAK